MNGVKLRESIAEAHRFLARAEGLLKIAEAGERGKGREVPTWEYPKERGAVRRASMDLTRSLADLRRSS